MRSSFRTPRRVLDRRALVKRRKQNAKVQVDPNSLSAQLGEVLRKHRIARGLTQAELAEIVDISLGFLGQVERGEGYASISIWEALAKTLGFLPFRCFPAADDDDLVVRKRADAMAQSRKRAVAMAHALINDVKQLIPRISWAPDLQEKLRIKVKELEIAGAIVPAFPPAC